MTITRGISRTDALEGIPSPAVVLHRTQSGVAFSVSSQYTEGGGVGGVGGRGEKGGGCFRQKRKRADKELGSDNMAHYRP